MQKFTLLVLKFKPHYGALLLIILLSAFLNTHNIHFPDFYHPDKLKKVQFVLSGQQDFRHPILMLQTRSHDQRAHPECLSLPSKVWFERYTLCRGWTKRNLTEMGIAEARKAGVAYLLASSFNYERFFIGTEWSGQNPGVYETHKKYARIFSYPYKEIKPAYKTFAFSNPVIRIIDIRDPENQGDSANKSGR